MAKSVPNPSTGNLKGRIGKLVYYELHGKPCVRSVPDRKEPPTSAEKNNQNRFRAASKFAHFTLSDPKQKARYLEAGAKTGSSAYNVAVSDFMHAPVITEVDLTGYTGRAGQSIRILAEERMIGAMAVNVVIADQSKVLLEQGAAKVEDNGLTWSYAAQTGYAAGPVPLDHRHRGGSSWQPHQQDGTPCDRLNPKRQKYAIRSPSAVA
jgi:hypothetical protein